MSVTFDTTSFVYAIRVLTFFQSLRFMKAPLRVERESLSPSGRAERDQEDGLFRFEKRMAD